MSVLAALSANMELAPRTWFDKLESVTKELYQKVPLNEDEGLGAANEGNSTVVSDSVVSQKRAQGDDLLRAAADAYEKRRESSSDARWLSMVRRSGTAADKVAALTLAIQDDAIANLSNLKSLVGMYHSNEWSGKSLHWNLMTFSLDISMNLCLIHTQHLTSTHTRTHTHTDSNQPLFPCFSSITHS